MPQRLFEVWEVEQTQELEAFLASQEGAVLLAALADCNQEVTFGESSECHGVDAVVLAPQGIKSYQGMHGTSAAASSLTEEQRAAISANYKDTTAEQAVSYFRRYSLYYEPNISIVDWLKDRHAWLRAFMA